jgi:hypothetical protein
MSKNQNGLEAIRARIDQIDSQLVELLSRRAATLGSHYAGPARGARSEIVDASVSHADGWLHAHGATAAE